MFLSVLWTIAYIILTARWISTFIRTSSDIPTSHGYLRAGWISRRFNISQDTPRLIWRCAFIRIISTNRASKAPRKRSAPHLAENRCHIGSVPLSYFRQKRCFKDVKSKIKIMKKIQKSSMNLVKNLFLGEEKPHFRRSAVWQAAPIKISAVFIVFSMAFSALHYLRYPWDQKNCCAINHIFCLPYVSWRKCSFCVRKNHMHIYYASDYLLMWLIAFSI